MLDLLQLHCSVRRGGAVYQSPADGRRGPALLWAGNNDDNNDGADDNDNGDDNNNVDQMALFNPVRKQDLVNKTDMVLVISTRGVELQDKATLTEAALGKVCPSSTTPASQHTVFVPVPGSGSPHAKEPVLDPGSGYCRLSGAHPQSTLHLLGCHELQPWNGGRKRLVKHHRDAE